MKNALYLLVLIIFFSCGNEKVLHLPEIEHSDITEIQDVSAAYLFYDETKKDSVELNRKNLISTTNWLVNVDKRLTLKQAIPHIKFLQEKKQNSSHKNKNAKNYFTCNDLSRTNLGFIEFTDVDYYEMKYAEYLAKQSNFDFLKTIQIEVLTLEKINIKTNSKNIKKSNIDNLITDISEILNNLNEEKSLVLSIKSSNTFQNYILIKNILNNLRFKHVKISEKEFIPN